jgi:hypothetical protein
VCPIEVPPLRGRTEDVRGRSRFMRLAAASRRGMPMPRIGENAWRALESHPWPGNVRELGNVMERLVIYHAGRDVEPADLGLPQSLRASLFPYNAPQAAPSEAARSRPPAPSWGREQSSSAGGNVPYAPDSVSELQRAERRRPRAASGVPTIRGTSRRTSTTRRPSRGAGSPTSLRFPRDRSPSTFPRGARRSTISSGRSWPRCSHAPTATSRALPDPWE